MKEGFDNVELWEEDYIMYRIAMDLFSHQILARMKVKKLKLEESNYSGSEDS